MDCSKRPNGIDYAVQEYTETAKWHYVTPYEPRTLEDAIKFAKERIEWWGSKPRVVKVSRYWDGIEPPPAHLVVWTV